MVCYFPGRLNDDCILEIFKYLDLHDVVKLALLNRRLASLVAYHHRNVDCIHDLRLVHRRELHFTLLALRNNDSLLQFIARDWRRIGHVIERVKLATAVVDRHVSNASMRYESMPQVRLPDDMLQLFEQFCTGGSLGHLTLSDLYASANFANHQALFRQLTCVRFQNVRIREYLLGQLLSQCASIRQLELRHMNVCGACLRQLPMRTLHEITIYQEARYCQWDADVLLDFVQRNPQLTAINFNETVLRRVMPELMRYYRNLTAIEFDAAGFEPRYRPFDCQLFDGLQWDRLKRLFIARFIIDEHVLRGIGNLQHLERLGLVENLESDVDDEEFALLFSRVREVKSLCYISNAALSERRLLFIVLNTRQLQKLIVDVNQFEFTAELLQRLAAIVKRQHEVLPLVLILRNERSRRSAALDVAIQMNRHIVDVKSSLYFDATDYVRYCTRA